MRSEQRETEPANGVGNKDKLAALNGQIKNSCMQNSMLFFQVKMLVDDMKCVHRILLNEAHVYNVYIKQINNNFVSLNRLYQGAMGLAASVHVDLCSPPPELSSMYC